ncbi:hypothetical protein AgCh_016131 [Apium graveolens]
MEMEFLELKQGDRSVTEYKAKFTELARIAPEYTYTSVFQAALVIESDQRLVAKEQDEKKRKFENGPARSESGGVSQKFQRWFGKNKNKKFRRQNFPQARPSTSSKGHYSTECKSETQGVTYFSCGKVGHIARNCKSVTQDSVGRSVSQGPVTSTARARTFKMTKKSPAHDSDVVASTLSLNSVPVNVLFDSGASKSFISMNCVNKLQLMLEDLDEPLTIEVANKNKVHVSQFCPKCSIEISGYTFPADLIPFELGDFDVILGMDWLSLYKANIDWYEAYLAHVVDTKKETPTLDEIPIVREFPDVFPEELNYWIRELFDNGGAAGTPSIIFEVNDVEHVVSPGVVRKALHLPEGCIFSIVEEPVLQQLMASLGKLGQLKRAKIRKEWSFFFDCITKAFANKCSNFDAIPIMSQHIGYALIHQTHFDFASVVLGFIGDRMTKDRNVVYFARFCQLIYKFCCADEPQPTTDLIPPFKLAKQAFNDLSNADIKKQVVRPLQIPQSVKQILVNADPQTYTSVFPDVQPTSTSQLPQQPSEHITPTSQTSQPQPTQPSIRTYFKPSQKSQPSPSAHPVRPSSSKPKRTKIVPQTQQKRRRIVLRDESDSEEQVPVKEHVVVEDEKIPSQKANKAGSSKLLKRLRRMYSDETPTVSPPSKRHKKQRARRPVSVSSHSEETLEEGAKEGGQESLIPTEPIVVDFLPSAQPKPTQDRISTPPVSPVTHPVHTEDPGTSADIDIHNLIVPEVLYLEAPPAPITPPSTPIPDADFNPELHTTPSLHLDPDDHILGEHQNMAVDQNLVGDQHLEDDVEASIASHTVLLLEDADDVDSVTGPSGHAPLQAPSKAELVKKFVRGDAPVPWSETHRGKEWTKEWNSVSFVPSEKILAEHLAKADEMLVNDDFKIQLRVTALSTRHLQGQQSVTQAKVDKIQKSLNQQDTVVKLDKKLFFKPTFDKIANIEKTQEKQQAQIDEILKNQASHQNQLNEIQSSVELLVSLLLPTDAKKGEKEN